MKRQLLTAAAGAVLVSTAVSGALAADVGPIIINQAPAAPAVAAPAPVSEAGPYVSVFGGLILPISVNAWAHLGSGCTDTWPLEEANDCDAFSVQTARGYRIGGAVGMYMNPNMAVEGEVTFGSVALAAGGPVGGPLEPLPDDNGASAHLMSLMANVMFGMPTGGFKPYVSLGAGAVRVSLDIPADVFGPDFVLDSDWTWGAQILAGVDVEVGNGVSIGARYRGQLVGPTQFLDDGPDNVYLDRFFNHGIELVLTLGM